MRALWLVAVACSLSARRSSAAQHVDRGSAAHETEPDQESRSEDRVMRRERSAPQRSSRLSLADAGGEDAQPAPVQDRVEPVPGPDRTLDRIVRRAAEHDQNVTHFIRRMRDQLERQCETGPCEAILDKLVRTIEKHENRVLDHIMKELPVSTTPDPYAVEQSPDWTETFSTMLRQRSPRSLYPVDKVKCIGRFCGSLQVHYLEKELDLVGGTYTQWFNEFPPGIAQCPRGHVVMQVECSGLFCGRMRLLCHRPNATLWQVDDSATEERGWFNEEWPGVSGCSAGYALYGIKCSGLYCHTMKLMCKGAKPAARDCTWGPWSEWSECRGMCSYSFQYRNRSVWYDEMWGGRCDGPSEGRQRCNMRFCSS